MSGRSSAPVESITRGLSIDSPGTVAGGVLLRIDKGDFHSPVGRVERGSITTGACADYDQLCRRRHGVNSQLLNSQLPRHSPWELGVGTWGVVVRVHAKLRAQERRAV